jgi:hypothetical protein
MFYVYLWLRYDGIPYYVGKGKSNRAWLSHPGHRPPKDSSRIILQYYNSELDAFKAEKFFISFWGRKDLRTGCLRNRTDGGDGTSGRKVSFEFRQRMQGNTNGLGYRHLKEALVRIGHTAKGRIWSAESRKKLGLSKIGNTYFEGHTLSLEHKQSIIEANKRRKGLPWTPNRRAAQIRKKNNAQPS